MVDSTDLAQVLHEAKDIAQSVAQKLTSAHVLLALFTVENRAQLLLKESGVDEDSLLEMMTSQPRRSRTGLVRELCERAREIARAAAARARDGLPAPAHRRHPRALRARRSCSREAGLDLISPAQHRPLLLPERPHAPQAPAGPRPPRWPSRPVPTRAPGRARPRPCPPPPLR